MHDGIWGYVSTVNWNKENADVVCRQLSSPGVDGFEMIDSPTSIIYEGSVIWLHDVHCNGDEQNLLDCRTSPWIVNKTTRNKTLKPLANFTCIKSKLLFFTLK